MEPYLHSLLKKLRQEVLDVAEVRKMMSSDCYRVAQDISIKTSKSISTTTLKRVYGYAQSRFMLSQFTLNVLAEYCGYDSWSHYIHQKELGGIGNTYWSDLKSFCHERTRDNLALNERNSGIPFSLTVRRLAVEQHLSEFMESNRTVTFLCADKGMGKTIALTQWVARRLSDVSNKKKDDIFMYTSATSLSIDAKFSSSWRIWLADLLRLPSPDSLNRFFQEFSPSSRGNFILIIEDFNNTWVFKKRFNMIFKEMVDMIRQLRQYTWIKLILSILPSTWQQYGHRIEGLRFGKSCWHSVFRLPEFSYKELEVLAAGINGRRMKINPLYLKRFSFITQPIYTECFYKLKNKRIPITALSYGDLYAISILYLRKYISKRSKIEYQYFIFQLTHYLNFANDLAFVNKRDIMFLLRNNSAVYHDLILKGVLYEYQNEKRNSSTCQIIFKSSSIASYYIALRVIDTHNFDFVSCFAERYGDQKYPRDIKALVLNWLMLFYVESNELIRNYLSKEAQPAD